MKRKKLPLWLSLVLSLCLAVFCVGSTILIGASIADPELYAQLTDPVKAFLSKQADAMGTQMNKMGDAIDDSYQGMQDYFEEKKEEREAAKALAEAEAEAEPDPQALSEASLVSTRALADPVVTHFTTDPSGQLEMLLGGNYEMVYFNQTDPQWGEYGSDSIAGYGCGPTSMAMVVSSMTGMVVSPQEMANIFVDEGYWANRSGTYYSFAEGSADLFGLNMTPLVPEEMSASALIGHLMSDNLIIALMSTGHFTNSGHYIILRGATLSGDILVADPASRDRSLTLWDPQLILDELSESRYHGAPLWVFAPKTAPLDDSETFLIP